MDTLQCKKGFIQSHKITSERERERCNETHLHWNMTLNLDLCLQQHITLEQPFVFFQAIHMLINTQHL